MPNPTSKLLAQSSPFVSTQHKLLFLRDRVCLHAKRSYGFRRVLSLGFYNDIERNVCGDPPRNREEDLRDPSIADVCTPKQATIPSSNLYPNIPFIFSSTSFTSSILPATTSLFRFCHKLEIILFSYYNFLRASCLLPL